MRWIVKVQMDGELNTHNYYFDNETMANAFYFAISKVFQKFFTMKVRVHFPEKVKGEVK